MKKVLILFAAIAFMIVSGAWMVYGQEVQGSGDAMCLTVQPLIYKMCIDGYEYTTVKQGCIIVGFTQAFEIYPKRSGKPKMMLPIPCNEIEPTPIP